jgi:hypothetical protein
MSSFLLCLSFFTISLIFCFIFIFLNFTSFVFFFYSLCLPLSSFFTLSLSLFLLSSLSHIFAIFHCLPFILSLHFYSISLFHFNCLFVSSVTFVSFIYVFALYLFMFSIFLLTITFLYVSLFLYLSSSLAPCVFLTLDLSFQLFNLTQRQNKLGCLSLIVFQASLIFASKAMSLPICFAVVKVSICGGKALLEGTRLA